MCQVLLCPRQTVFFSTAQNQDRQRGRRKGNSLFTIEESETRAGGHRLDPYEATWEGSVQGPLLGVCKASVRCWSILNTLAKHVLASVL